MGRLVCLLLSLSLALAPCVAETKLQVTVVEKRTGAPVTDLAASDFTVTVDKVTKPVTAAEYASSPIDVMLLLDSSAVGEMVKPVSADLIGQLGEKEQMAIVAYHSSADLIQDFTGSKQALLEAVSDVRFGNSPRMLDALYAAIADGFANATFRRVVILLTTGIDGPSRVREQDTVRLARRNGVSIYPVFVMGYGKSLFERLARETGGAAFSLRDMSKRVEGSATERIFNVMRNNYTLTLPGNLPLGDNVQVEVPGRKNLLVSSLPLD